MLLRFFLKILYWNWLMICMVKSTNLQKAIRLQASKIIFPYVTKFMDKRLFSYLSLFYECELYSLEELEEDLCGLIYNKQSFAIEAHLEPSYLKSEPIYTLLTLF